MPNRQATRWLFKIAQPSSTPWLGAGTIAVAASFSACSVDVADSCSTGSCPPSDASSPSCTTSTCGASNIHRDAAPSQPPSREAGAVIHDSGRVSLPEASVAEPTVRQSARANGASGTLNEAPLTGSVLCLAVFANTAVTVSNVSGGGVETWISGSNADPPGGAMVLYWGVVGSDPSPTMTVTLAGTTAYVGLYILEMQGVTGVDTSMTTSGNGATVTVPTLSLAGPEEVVLTQSWLQGGAVSAVTDNGFTDSFSAVGNGPGVFQSYALLGAASTYVPEVYTQPSGAWYSQAIAFDGRLVVSSPSPDSGTSSEPPTTAGDAGVVVNPRNVFAQPFDANDPWNLPIGKGGGGLVAGGTGLNGGTVMQYADKTGPIYHPANINVSGFGLWNDEAPTLYGPSSPVQPVYTNTVAWNGDQTARCDAQQTLNGDHVPVPTQALFTDVDGNTEVSNSCGVVLLTDRMTLYSNQPMQICTVGGPITTEYTPTAGDFPLTSIFGTSPNGSHGSGGLSSIGGAIKYNELIAGNSPLVAGVQDVIRHALGSASPTIWSAFGQGVWPATGHDGGNEGVFFALLPTFDYQSLQTPVGRSIAWTLINYGGYVNDDSGGDFLTLSLEYTYNDESVDYPGYPGVARAMDQVKSSLGVDFSPGNIVLGTGPLGQDFLTIFSNVYVIVNNSASLPAAGPGSQGRLQSLLPNPPVDPGSVTAAPVITAAQFRLGASGVVAGTYVGTATATSYPYSWSLSGANASYFNIGTFTGAIVVSTAGATAITSGATYTLTVTGTNVVGSATGTLIIKT
jgi:hypothetical protein